MPKEVHTTYPDGEALSAFLSSTGLDIPADLDTESKAGSAVDEWEERTGWHSYLSTGNASLRLFDPPENGRNLYLQSGLLDLTSLTVGVVPDAAGNYAAGNYAAGNYAAGGTSGSLLTPNLNFYPRPQNAKARGLAVTEIEFVSRIRGVAQSVAIFGVWGRVLAVPDDVWQALLQKAALLSVPELSVSISGGYYERKIGDSLKRYGGAADSGPLAQQATLWNTAFERAVMNKKRVTA